MRMPAQEVVPTEEWANFYGLGNTLNGQPLPVGVVIRAYDPQGVVCGQFRVTRAGCYGLMPVCGGLLASSRASAPCLGDVIALQAVIGDISPIRYDASLAIFLPSLTGNDPMVSIVSHKMDVLLFPLG